MSAVRRIARRPSSRDGAADRVATESPGALPGLLNRNGPPAKQAGRSTIIRRIHGRILRAELSAGVTTCDWAGRGSSPRRGGYARGHERAPPRAERSGHRHPASHDEQRDGRVSRVSTKSLSLERGDGSNPGGAWRSGQRARSNSRCRRSESDHLRRRDAQVRSVGIWTRRIPSCTVRVPPPTDDPAFVEGLLRARPLRSTQLGTMLMM
jgi:hypothetical protein